jgi:Ethanolamine utilization protein EutJ (predicted chaperonin)
MSDEKQGDMAYIGRHPKCGHIVFAVVDVQGREKQTARDVAGAVRDGLKIERMTVEAVRSAPDWCDDKCSRRAGTTRQLIPDSTTAIPDLGIFAPLKPMTVTETPKGAA